MVLTDTKDSMPSGTDWEQAYLIDQDPPVSLMPRHPPSKDNTERGRICRASLLALAVLGFIVAVTSTSTKPAGIKETLTTQLLADDELADLDGDGTTQGISAVLALVKSEGEGNEGVKAAGDLLAATGSVCTSLASAQPQICLPLAVAGGVMSGQSGAPSEVDQKLDKLYNKLRDFQREMESDKFDEIVVQYDALQDCLRRKQNNYTDCYQHVLGRADLNKYLAYLQRSDFEGSFVNIWKSDDLAWNGYLEIPEARVKLHALLVMCCRKENHGHCPGGSLTALTRKLKEDMQDFKDAYEEGRTKCREEGYYRLACYNGDFAHEAHWRDSGASPLARQFIEHGDMYFDGGNWVTGQLADVKFTNITHLKIVAGGLDGNDGCKLKGNLSDLKGSKLIALNYGGRWDMADTAALQDKRMGEAVAIAKAEGIPFVAGVVGGPIFYVGGMVASGLGVGSTATSLVVQDSVIQGSLSDLAGTRIERLGLAYNPLITGKLSDLKSDEIHVRALDLSGNDQITGMISQFVEVGVRKVAIDQDFTKEDLTGEHCTDDNQDIQHIDQMPSDWSQPKNETLWYEYKE